MNKYKSCTFQLDSVETNQENHDCHDSARFLGLDYNNFSICNMMKLPFMHYSKIAEHLFFDQSDKARN